MGSTRVRRGAAEDLGVWLTRLHDGRRHTDLMGESPDDDIVDPMGGTPDDYRQMLTDVSGLTETLRNLAWPTATLRAAGSGGARRRRRRVSQGMSAEMGTRALDHSSIIGAPIPCAEGIGASSDAALLS